MLGGISKDNPEDRGLSERCLVGFNTGPPMLPSKYNNNMQLLQFSDHVVVVTEMIHDAHIIPLDGRPDLNPAITQWAGNSRGHWEGDTLVYEFTINDPATFVEPIKGIMHMRRSPDRVYEYACHEGNYAMPGILAGARRDESGL